MRVTINYTDGRPDTEHDDYDAAIEHLICEFPGCEYGHDGDLTDGGDRTLVWADEESSINDDGGKAVASIRAAD